MQVWLYIQTHVQELFNKPPKPPLTTEIGHRIAGLPGITEWDFTRSRSYNHNQNNQASMKLKGGILDPVTRQFCYILYLISIDKANLQDKWVSFLSLLLALWAPSPWRRLLSTTWVCTLPSSLWSQYCMCSIFVFTVLFGEYSQNFFSFFSSSTVVISVTYSTVYISKYCPNDVWSSFYITSCNTHLCRT